MVLQLSAPRRSSSIRCVLQLDPISIEMSRFELERRTISGPENQDYEVVLVSYEEICSLPTLDD